MAKQRGIYKSAGKIEGRSYYYSQTGGYLSRNINPGMSDRVKTDAAFANTRRNANEFGGAGKLAGAIIRPVSQRWRYILNPTATGDLAKVIAEGMRLDTLNVWGHRELQLIAMAGVQDVYNQQSKNEMPSIIVQGLASGNIYSDRSKFLVSANDVEMDGDFVNTMLAKGAEGVIVNVYSFSASVPKVNPASGKYFATTSRLLLLDSIDEEIALGNRLVESAEFNCSLTDKTKPFPPENTADHLSGLLVIMLPYKVVSNEKYILQEHCAAYWSALSAAE